MRKRILLVLLILILFGTTAKSTVGPTWPDLYPPWEGPDPPPDGTCENDTGYITNGNPVNEEEDVVIIPGKGVQTCINVTVPSGCEANITLQWLNWSLYFDIWLEWAYEQDWWWGFIDWDTEPTWDNDSLWSNYSNWTINTSQQLCAYNINVTCFTLGNYETQWFDWRIIANFTCPNNETYNTSCYYYFTAEECSITHIFPPSPNGTACPCCSPLCIEINNEFGNPMNITVYRNDSMNETFYIVDKYIEVPNGTYCFCLCGHVDDIYYPMRYNETYHWYVNTTDSVTGTSTNSSMFQFRTEANISNCPCGIDDLTELIEDTDTIRDDAWLIGLIVLFFGVVLVMRRRRI